MFQICLNGSARHKVTVNIESKQVGRTFKKEVTSVPLSLPPPPLLQRPGRLKK